MFRDKALMFNFDEMNREESSSLIIHLCTFSVFNRPVSSDRNFSLPVKIQFHRVTIARARAHFRTRGELMEYACVVLVSWDESQLVLDSSFLLTLTNLGHGSIRDSVIDVTIVLSLSLSLYRSSRAGYV